MLEIISSVPKIDWLSFTLPVRGMADLQACVSTWAARLGGGIERESSMYFYARCIRILDSGLLLFHPDRLEMGVHISLPASALGKLRLTVLDMLKLIADSGGSVNRLDVAIDTDRVHIDEIHQSIVAKEIVTKAHRKTYVGDFDDPGETIYIGSPDSMRRVRIYDKAAEQGISDGTVWTRCEVQLRKDHAAQAAAFILQGGEAVEVVASSIDFRSVTGDSNVTRRPQVAWWSAWLGYASGLVSFALEKTSATVESMRAWIRKQVVPALAFLGIVDHGNRQWLTEAMREGVKKLPEWKVSRAVALAANL